MHFVIHYMLEPTAILCLVCGCIALWSMIAFALYQCVRSIIQTMRGRG